MKLCNGGIEFYCSRLTCFGPIAVGWSRCRNEPRVERILLPNGAKPDLGRIPGPEGLWPRAEEGSCQEIVTLFDQIECFTSGAETQFSVDLLRLDRCSEFQQKVLAADSSIPRGRVSSYGIISAHLGIHGGARAVGTALATNPFPLVIPCHRAIRSDGSLGGYQGGLKMKKILLDREGILFQGENKVLNPDFYLF